MTDGLKLRIKEKVFVEAPPENIYSHVVKDNSFLNPKYESNEKHGYSNWKTPHLIQTFEDFNAGILLPRGYTPELIKICDSSGLKTSLEDLRVNQPKAFPSLNVVLRPYQKKAVEAALKVDCGVIISPTGSGKTLIGLAIIRQRKQKTLIIVHRSDLAKQWIEKIQDKLGLKAGLIGDGNFEIGDVITVAMIQTLTANQEETKRLTDSFGLVLVDEVHHVPADSFSAVVGKMSAKYLYGLSATLGRRDGLEQMIYRFIGPAIINISRAEVEALGSTVPASVILVETGFNPGNVNSWNEYLNALSTDSKRNLLIIDLAQKASAPTLILCDRVSHAEQLSEMLSKRDVKHVLAHGKLKSDDREKAMEELKKTPITVGTTGLLGEGLDVSSWSVLILASPISSEIKLMQAIGRIIRPYKGKDRSLVYDLRDNCGFAGSSFNRRFELYKKYKIWVNF